MVSATGRPDRREAGGGAALLTLIVCVKPLSVSKSSGEEERGPERVTAAAGTEDDVVGDGDWVVVVVDLEEAPVVERDLDPCRGWWGRRAKLPVALMASVPPLTVKTLLGLSEVLVALSFCKSVPALTVAYSPKEPVLIGIEIVRFSLLAFWLTMSPPAVATRPGRERGERDRLGGCVRCSAGRSGSRCRRCWSASGCRRSS